MESHRVVGEYEMVGDLGAGQFGKVYKAAKPSDPNNFYAIKQIAKKSLEKNAKLAELFKTEVKVMKYINHPNILHCYEF